MSSASHPAMHELPSDALSEVADYFRALAEPVRLQILNRLRQGPCNVSDLAEGCQCSVANVSRHLSLLSKHGLIERESRGTSAYYRIADPCLDPLCDLVCDSIARRLQRRALAHAPFLAGRLPETPSQ